MPLYKIENLGRRKWCGTVKTQSLEQEHVEAALDTVARKHLISSDIDFSGTIEEGHFVVGGFRTVGTYKLIER